MFSARASRGVGIEPAHGAPQVVAVERAAADALAAGRPVVDRDPRRRVGLAGDGATHHRVVDVRGGRPAGVPDVAQVPAFADPLAGAHQRRHVHVRHSIAVLATAARIAALGHDLVAVAVRGVAGIGHPTTCRGLQQLVARVGAGHPVGGVVVVGGVVAEAAAVALGHGIPIGPAADEVHRQTPVRRVAVVAVGGRSPHHPVVQAGLGHEVQDVLGCGLLPGDQVAGESIDHGDDVLAIQIFDPAVDHLGFELARDVGEQVGVDHQTHVHVILDAQLVQAFVGQRLPFVQRGLVGGMGGVPAVRRHRRRKLTIAASQNSQRQGEQDVLGRKSDAMHAFSFYNDSRSCESSDCTARRKLKKVDFNCLLTG